MSKKMPLEFQANLKSLRFMSVIFAVCGLITIIGFPWSLFYLYVAYAVKCDRKPKLNLINFAIAVTIPICIAIVPIFLLLQLIRVRKMTIAFSANEKTGFASNKLWQKKHFVNKYPLLTYLSAALLSFLLLMTPVPITKSATATKPFQTQYIQDSGIELGDSQTRQAGINGQQLEKQALVKPLFAIVFRTNGYYSSKALTPEITLTPTNEIIAKGTKKYQYMWCSNGSYRYYTNEQFANPNTGFTHKSTDYCAQNNTGHMTGLADTAPAQQTTQTIYKSTPSISLPTYTTCHDYAYTNTFSCTTY